MLVDRTFADPLAISVYPQHEGTYFLGGNARQQSKQFPQSSSKLVPIWRASTEKAGDRSGLFCASALRAESIRAIAILRSNAVRALQEIPYAQY